MTDLIPAVTVLAAVALAVIAVRTAFAERWKRIESEQQRDLLADVLTRGKHTAEELLRRYSTPSRN